MSVVGVIGGSGLARLEGLEVTERLAVDTPFGRPSAPLVRGRLAGADTVFLARHGPGHTIPPHRVNYRANVWALREAGVSAIVAVAAVGGIDAALRPGVLAIPEQIVDYTWGRASTFFEDGLEDVVHVDFTHPYCPVLRARLLAAAGALGIECIDGGVYGATQGPRLESAAEIDRMERDGCTMVGMTGMPEAGLAREAGLDYAHCALSVNLAAGRGGEPLTMAVIGAHLETGMARVRALLPGVLAGA